MALSQIQCLDNNHVNPRTHESKPEFLYCEDQRLALEAFLQDGREEFVKFLEARGVRDFLSDPELETLAELVEPYDPGSELYPEGYEAEEDGDEPPLPLSLQYWPELSDTSIPQMDLGWPDSASYRGVTRTTVYAQPPLEGQVHIKEVVRKMIAQAQKVIAVVMDVFTDVDIFRDLLDAGVKRKVSVYILLERTTLPHFRSMCQRANMHAGHLKQLRVRCTDGAEFHTRSCTKVRGRMGHRFMFVDGDKAVSGSYGFTWMSSRLDKSLITVVTGQAVEAFDRLFRILYATSSLVDLRQVATEPEPALEPLSQPALLALPSAAMARKMYSPKYTLVTLGNPSPTPSANSKETQEDSKNPENKKRRRKSKEAVQEAPPLHPGLTNLEKVCMMSYLPTWPEPDPPSDVIGYINIRDARKPNQVHLQRSEMFETSQAIRFSTPFSMPKETLPEVAKPRQLSAKNEEINKLRQWRDKAKAEESARGSAQPTQLNAGPGDIKNKAEAPGQKGPKCESDKDTTKTLNTENKQHSNTPTNHDAHTPRQSSSKESTPNAGRPLHATPQTVATLPGSNTEKETNSNTQCAAGYRMHAIESSSTQEPHLRPPTDWNSNTEPHTQTKTVPPHTDSHTRAVHTQPHHSSEMTPNTQTPAVNSHTSSSTSAERSQSVISTSTLSENSHVSVATSTTTSAFSPLSSISSSSSTPPLTSSSPTPNPLLPSSSASPPLTPTPPVPKPRTVQLVFKGGVIGDGQKLPEVSVVRKPETSTVIHNVATVTQKLPEKVPETVPTEAQKDPESTLNIGESPPHKQSGTSQERKNEEADERQHQIAGMQLDAGNKAKSNVSITDAPKAERVNIQETIPKDAEPKLLTSADCELTPQIDGVATVQTELKAPERAQVPNEKSENVTERKTYLARAHLPQRISYSELTPQDIDALETVKAPTHTPVSATHTSKDTQGQQSNPSFTPAHRTDSTPNTAKNNITFQVQVPKAWGSTPEGPLRLHLPDIYTPDFLSPTPEIESRLLAALMRSPTADGFLPRTPTPDSQMHTPDPRPYTPDFRTPTSDGYTSSRAGSALSTTSDEYYECCDSPLNEPYFAFRNHGMTEDHVSFTNTPNATSDITSPAYLNSNTRAASLGTTDSNSSSLSGSASVSSLSSLLERKVKMEEETETANEENGRDEDEEGRKGERRTEGGYQETERRGSEEDAKRTAETEEKNKEAQTQVPKRKRVLNQSAAEKRVDGRVTPRELSNERTGPKRKSTGDLQPKKTSSERKRPDKEKAVDKAALGPSSVERRERPQSTDIQKLLHTPPRTPPRTSRGLQQDSAPASPSRPSRPLRPVATNQALGSRPSGSRQLNHAESKAIHGSLQALNNVSSPRRPPSRPPPPATAGAVGSAAGRKQAEVSQSHQSLLSRQPPAAQGRTRAGQSQNQHPYPKPQASFLHTHSNREEQLQPHSQKQTVSQREAHWQEEGKAPFSFSFSKLYSLKGLKDKMSKLPAQSKRGGASSP
ncbi:uncharacterized protein LOC141780132 [Sebastes fasciatus]|uniref:uncharacterized protein LOC141780132 n=1 Tax=Sebastes fasciatus TaxID=394691 RepID=UPI003D9EBBDC